jgi:hypothetical protein
MSASNPDITVSDIITDVQSRLLGSSIDGSVFIPWVSYAYQKVYNTLASVGQKTKEELFGNLVTVDLTPGVAEYSISSNIPRYGGIIKIEVRYGATGDDWNRATRLESISNWEIQNNVSTTYRSKTQPVFYIIQNIMGFIPTPPSTESDQTPQAKIWYIQRPNQLTLTTDVIDIPYRFMYPITNYVQARAIERENEDYDVALAIENKFKVELEEIADAADSETGQNNVQISSTSALYENPFNY